MQFPKFENFKFETNGKGLKKRIAITVAESLE